LDDGQVAGRFRQGLDLGTRKLFTQTESRREFREDLSQKARIRRFGCSTFDLERVWLGTELVEP
jgi:hypothetical protein